MAGSSKPRRMRSRRMWAALAALACWPAVSQTRLSLEALGARGPQPDSLSAHHGESVVVRGVVSARAFHFPDYRSEEHTSELQSLRHLVCRLLLEKKKQLQ